MHLKNGMMSLEVRDRMYMCTFCNLGVSHGIGIIGTMGAKFGVVLKRHIK